MNSIPSVNDLTESGRPLAMSARDRMAADCDRFLVWLLDIGIVCVLASYLIQNFMAPQVGVGQSFLVFLLVGFLPARLAVAGGYKRMARWWFVGGMSLGMMVLPVLVNGLRTPIFAVAPLALLVTAWLLGRRWMAVQGLAYAAIMGAYWLAESMGWFVPPLPLRSIDIWLLVDLQVVSLTVVVMWGLLRSYESVQEAETLLHDKLALEVDRSNAARQQLAEIYDGLSAHVCVLDGEGSILSVNQAWRDFFAANGGPPDWTHEGISYLEVCTSAIRSASPDMQDAANFYVMLQEVLANKRSHFEMEYPCHSQTEKRWFFVRVTRIAHVAAVRIVVAHDDITQVKLAQEALKASLGFTRNLIESMQEGFSVLDSTGCAMDANPALCRMTGFACDELEGIKAPFPYWPPEEYDNIRAAFEKTLRGEGGEFELTFMRKNGERFPAIVTASAVRDDAGQVVSFVATVSDITERKRSQDQIHRLAFYDPLTSLPNRRLLTDRMSQTLAVCKRSGKFAALLVLDLDNFKTLNDAHGHAAGDLLLIEVAQRIKSCVREVDTVARFGGDEFVVLIQELSTDAITSREQLNAIAEKIRFLLAQPYRFLRGQQGWLEHRCTASIGCALFNETVSDEAEILKLADQAMYQAKSDGRNRVCCHDTPKGAFEG